MAEMSSGVAGGFPSDHTPEGSAATRFSSSSPISLFRSKTISSMVICSPASTR